MLSIKIVKRFNSRKEYLEHIPSPVIYDIDKGSEDLTIDNSKYLKEIEMKLQKPMFLTARNSMLNLEKVFSVR